MTCFHLYNFLVTLVLDFKTSPAGHDELECHGNKGASKRAHTFEYVGKVAGRDKTVGKTARRERI